MPAAAVIPAPIAYIKVVAVKKLVVECLPRASCRSPCANVASASLGILAEKLVGIKLSACRFASFTVKKLECLKQAIAVNTLAWNNKIGLVAILLVCTTSND